MEWELRAPASVRYENLEVDVPAGRLSVRQTEEGGTTLEGLLELGREEGEAIRSARQGARGSLFEVHFEEPDYDYWALAQYGAFSSSTSWRHDRLSFHPVFVARDQSFRVDTAEDRQPGVTVRIRLSPGLAFVKLYGQTTGLRSFDDFSTEKSAAPAFEACGRTGFSVEHTRVLHRGELRSPILTIERQSILGFRRETSEPDCLEVAKDLVRLSDFCVGLLSCLYRRRVEVCAREIDKYVLAPAPVWLRSTSLYPTRTSPRSLEATGVEVDFSAFATLKEVVRRWPILPRIQRAVEALARTVSISEVAAFTERILALETLVAAWVQERGGLGSLRAAEEAESPFWAVDGRGRAMRWQSRWDRGETPPLNVSLWVCLEGLKVPWGDILDNPGVKPPFIHHRDAMLHGRSTATAAEIAHQSRLVMVLSLRILSRILGFFNVVGESPYEFAGVNKMIPAWFCVREKPGPWFNDIPAEARLPRWLRNPAEDSTGMGLGNE